MAIKNTSFIEANIINNSAKFQLYPSYSFWGVDFLKYFFTNLTFRLPIGNQQIERFGLKWYAWWRTTQQTFVQNFCQNICNEIAINLNFHFSHCKSMETLSCHSNQSAWATAIKNNIFVEAIVRNNSAKFQLYPPNSFWGVDFLYIFSQILPFGCNGNQPK